MTALVSVADVRTHVETDLTDTALQRLIDDADALIVREHGAHGELTVTIPGLNERFIFLERPITEASDISSIVESWSFLAGPLSRTLDETDFFVWYGGRGLERLQTGTHPAWGWAERVAITYTPTSDDARRIRVTIDLVRLAAQYEALRGETVGDLSVTFPDYALERAELIASLGPVVAFS
jgi:hypothetical protein